jgi:hypothetical protein
MPGPRQPAIVKERFNLLCQNWNKPARLRHNIEKPLRRHRNQGLRTADEYRASIKHAVEHGWIMMHERGTYL